MFLGFVYRIVLNCVAIFLSHVLGFHWFERSRFERSALHTFDSVPELIENDFGSSYSAWFMTFNVTRSWTRSAKSSSNHLGTTTPRIFESPCIHISRSMLHFREDLDICILYSLFSPNSCLIVCIWFLWIFSDIFLIYSIIQYRQRVELIVPVCSCCWYSEWSSVRNWLHKYLKDWCHSHLIFSMWYVFFYVR